VSSFFKFLMFLRSYWLLPNSCVSLQAQSSMSLKCIH